jgi:hypothetical protein
VLLRFWHLVSRCSCWSSARNASGSGSPPSDSKHIDGSSELEDQPSAAAPFPHQAMSRQYSHVGPHNCTSTPPLPRLFSDFNFARKRKSSIEAHALLRPISVTHPDVEFTGNSPKPRRKAGESRLRAAPPKALVQHWTRACQQVVVSPMWCGEKE